MPTLIIDNKEITVERGATIMEAARMLGIQIPHFCYHPKLCVAGNCRVCLVEVEKMPRPVASCAWPVNDGMVVHTQSEMARKARKGVLEFLLINHPLDCPICDQGGECQLQDLAMQHGPDRSRFAEEKREVANQDVGHLIETVMSRCIHCTRCIRFSEEISGVEEMGAVFRGDHMTVGTYVAKSISSEMSGNMIELCPVGALNSKPFHFKARSWELKGVKGVCHHCPVGCWVRRDTMNNAVQRVMSDACDPINENWLCDKGRFSCDGLHNNRLTMPQVRHEKGISPTTWREAIDNVADMLKGVKPEEIAGLADPGQAAEDLYAFQDLLRHSIGTPHIDHRLQQRDFSADSTPLTRADLLMNTPLVKIAEADVILLVGADSRQEMPLLNHRLRQAGRKKAAIFSVYPRSLRSNIPGLEQIIPVAGEEPAFMQEILALMQGHGKGGPVAEKIAALFKQAKRPVVVLGVHAVLHPQAEALRRQAVAILQACVATEAQWNGFNRLMPGGNAVAAQDLGVVPHRAAGYGRLDKVGYHAHKILTEAAAGKIKVLFLLGCDPSVDAVDTALAKKALAKAKVIAITPYMSDLIRQYANVALPSATIAEKEATLTNCEGRVQKSRQAVEPVGETREDWRIMRVLSDRLPVPLPYNTLEALQGRIATCDHRYQMTGLTAGELPPACDHSPVTVGLAIAPAAVQRMPDGYRVVDEANLFWDDQVSRNSLTLNKLAAKNVVRINPRLAESKGVAHGQMVRLIAQDRTIELVAEWDETVPQGTLFVWKGMGNQDLNDWENGYSLVSIVPL